MIALIMAGGVGSRFWPRSRKSCPKQYLSILSDKTMLQMTVQRLAPMIELNDVYIVTSENQKPMVQSNLPELPEENIIIEPFGMNTAPCSGLSAEYLKQRYSLDEQILVLPADHLIKKVDIFLSKVEKGQEYAGLGNLVTFGIQPEYPATGYGYIEGGAELEPSIHEVARFKEKPNLELAKEFLDAGNFFWNSGMFLWRLDTILNAFKMYLPKVSNLLGEISHFWKRNGVTADISEFYAKMPSIPIDIGIMEQAEKRVVLAVDLGWSDVGGWKALYEHLELDENGNTTYENSLLIDSKENLIQSEKFVALIGVDNLVVVDTEDALLIAAKDKSEKVKDIVNYLKKNKPELT